MENSYLFVYGTLRPHSGHAMGEWLARHGHYIGAGKVRGGLYQVSYYPALVSGDDWVQGEVYACAPDLWPELDRFEEATGPDAEYERRLSPVHMEGGQWLSAWTYWYLHPVTGLRRIGHGDWLAGREPR